MADWVTAKSADGTKVCAWILENVPSINYQDTPNSMRMILRWREDSMRVSIDALDRMLIVHHRHLWELPDDVWLDHDAKQPRKTPRAYQKWSEMETRHCVCCGEKIAKRYSSGEKVSPSRYTKMKFCSNACKFEGQVGAEGKRLVADAA